MSNNINLKGNIFGGVTAAIIALPLAIAFGVASGLGATAGIYGAIILGFFASLFGGTPTQISGPTGPMTVAVAAAVITLHNDVRLMAAVIFLTGIFQIIFGLIKIGKFVKYIPYPVISGFMSGVGAIIIILQINPYLGLEADANVMHLLFSLPSNISDINFAAVTIASLSLVIMFMTPTKVSKIIPTPLIALTILTPLSVFLNMPLDTIGEISVTMPTITFASLDFDHYRTIMVFAFTLALLGTIDTLLTSIVADSMTQTKHNPNKELFGQGLGNALCSLVGAVPGAGATMRTAINIKSGGTNRLSGMIHALTLIVIILFFAPFASQIPLALLAGILIKVGVEILDYRFIKIWKNSPRNDLAVMIAVFVITVFIDLIIAVGVGVMLSSLLIVYRIAKEANITIDAPEENTAEFDLKNKNTRIIKINGAFFFGSVTAFEDRINNILDTKNMIIDISDVPFIDITALFTLEDFIAKLQTHNIRTIIVSKERHKQKVLKLSKTQILEGVDFFSTIDEALHTL